MKKVLIIDDAPMYREFMQTQLTNYGFDVNTAINGLDGVSKIRSFLPDVIIMDYLLSRKSSLDVLKDKQRDPNAKDVPVILASANVDRQKILEVAPYGVRKFLNKPIKIDALLSALSEILGVDIRVDETPCLLDAHLNDQILFIEIARGFNNEKISLLQYKIAELLKLYKVQYPRILILMTDIQMRAEDKPKLDRLLQEVEKFVDTFNQVRILTLDDDIKSYIKYHTQYKGIEIAPSLEKAVSGLLGIRGMESMTSEQDGVQSVLLSSKNNLRSSEAFQLNFQDESKNELAGLMTRNVKIAVVDDDFIVHKIISKATEKTSWSLSYYKNGKEFTDKLGENRFDLLLLDLMMPEMDGFEVMEYIQAHSIDLPTVILSAMTKKESVMKAKELGVNSYLIKPLKPEAIIEKVLEVMIRLQAE
ncbi:response regulator [Oceanispirochaeta sp.]|jgi:CheY-like chemotaxis protein|uniref:response regulator n=1 Tax=Oceanispirochaeta sp. TaxID=2035350 RepID=UPI00261DBF56|nr:response regulator [Oceanispirochaeta sp.]MDA3957380.1 response regulator [Oceanispirochaeta sp.]